MGRFTYPWCSAGALRRQSSTISLRSSGMRRKQNFEISLYFLLTSFFAFLASFFSSCWAFSIGFILVGKVVRKAFRILLLYEGKGRCVVEQDFHGNFQVNVTWFFAFFSGVLDWIVLILVWFKRSLHSAQVSGQTCPWPLKLMTSQSVEGTWIRTGGYGRLRGEWVNQKTYKSPFADFFTWFSIKWPDLVVLCWKVDFSQKAWYFGGKKSSKTTKGLKTQKAWVQPVGCSQAGYGRHFAARSHVTTLVHKRPRI